MQPTYFSSFLLGKQNVRSPILLTDVVPHIDAWIFQNKNRRVERPANFNAFGESAHRLADQTLIQTRYVRASHAEYLAIRYEHGDRERRQWRTDVVFDSNSGTGNELRCSVGVHVGNRDGAIAPLGDVASRPAIVPKLINAFGAYEEYPLSTIPMRVAVGEVGLLVKLLTSPERHVPLVLITPRNKDGGFTVNKDHIAEKLAGMAFVVFADSAEATYAVREAISNDMNAYDGAVRLYWPGFKVSDSPYRHPLWLHTRIEEIETNQGGFSQFLLRDLARLSTTRVLPGVTRWEDVQRKKLLADAQAAHGEAELRELLELYMQQSTEQKVALDRLTEQLELKEFEIQERIAELDAKASECNQWRDAWIELSKSRPNLDEAVPQQFRDTSEALEKAAQLFADKLIVLPSAMRKEAQHFQRSEQIFKAMQWLASVYLQSKLGETLCPNLDLSCRMTVQMGYSPHQSRVTMGRFEDDYKIVRNGETKWLKEHIGTGSGTDPHYNIRIAFYFDESERKVVVGFVGQHQQTTASN